MKQLIRFCVVGCLNTGITYSVFYLSYRYWPFSTLLAFFPAGVAKGAVTGLRILGIDSIDAAFANVIGFVAGMGNSFVLNKLWTFKAAAGTKKQARRFIAANLLCLLVSTAAIFICTDVNHWPYNLVWGVTMVFVTAVNFSISKYWVFAQR